MAEVMRMSIDGEYPDAALRGVQKAKLILSASLVSAEVYRPDSRTAEHRKDRGKEVSINWEDDPGALAQLRGAGTSAANGIVRISRSSLDEIRREHVQGRFWYERARLPDNQYHGNFVFGSELSNPEVTHIAHVLAYFSKLVTL